MELWVKAVFFKGISDGSDGQSMMLLIISQAVFFCRSLCASSQFLLLLMCSYHLSFPHICA